QGRDEYLQDKTGIRFVAIPEGTFLMGSPPTEPGREDVETLHQVTLKPFLIAQHEVTQEEWQRVMTTNPSENHGDPLNPVESISWNEADEFCRRVDLALPTEAQWEYACRAGSETPYAGPQLKDLGWYLENSGDKSQHVRLKTPNGWGLYDMHG